MCMRCYVFLSDESGGLVIVPVRLLVITGLRLFVVVDWVSVAVEGLTLS